jgi:hypothetical protein
MAEAQTNDAALAEGLGAGFPQFPIPIAREKIPEVSAETKPKDLIPLYQQTAQRQMEVNQNLAQIDAAQKALSASEQAKITSRDLQDYEKNLAEKKRKEDQFPYPSFHPTQENAFSLGQIFSMIATAAVSMGNIGKVGGMGALGAMTGMLQGWRQGRIDLFNREKQEFDKKVNEIKLARDAIQKDWNDYLALRPLKVEEARAKLNELLSKVGQNSIIAGNIAKGDLNAVNNFLNGVSNVVNELEKQKRHSEEMEQRRKDRASREAQSRAFRLAMVQAKADEKSRKDIGSTSDYVKKFTGSKLKDKEAGEVLISANAVGDAFAIKQIVADHPEWIGRSGQIQQFFNRYIDSFYNNKPLPPDDQNLAADASGQEALVFAKRYAEYLVNYERALAGGARGFTVYFQRRFNDLLSQNQFNAQGMTNLMNEQIRTITSNAASKAPSLNRKNMIQMAYDIKSRTEDDEAIKGMQSLIGGEPIAPSPSKNLPNVGEVIDGYRFKGGNPANKSNWEMVQ